MEKKKYLMQQLLLGAENPSSGGVNFCVCDWDCIVSAVLVVISA
jgi:hypothetical protein